MHRRSSLETPFGIEREERLAVVLNLAQLRDHAVDERSHLLDVQLHVHLCAAELSVLRIAFEAALDVVELR